MEKKNKHYALGLAFLFLGVSAFTASHHEMWRDEIQAWLIARDSGSVFELFAHLKYEGHPGLWHLCLMPLTRITHSPVIMQVFHLLIAGIVVYLFVRYAPFNLLQKFLFCFGYFVLYEYAILARNYALGLLLIDVDIPDLQVVETANALQTQTSQNILIIMNRPLAPELIAQHNLNLLTEFIGSIVDDEGFYLYLMPAL